MDSYYFPKFEAVSLYIFGMLLCLKENHWNERNSIKYSVVGYENIYKWSLRDNIFSESS